MGALAGKNLNKSVTNHYKLDLLGFVDDLFGFLRAQRGVPSTRRVHKKNASSAVLCYRKAKGRKACQDYRQVVKRGVAEWNPCFGRDQIMNSEGVTALLCRPLRGSSFDVL